uniref:Uncharacterized protein LOC105037472 n=2 Tax=Elaeis guineensis var. tenera TaxID=51953 RepID=A0A6I9QPL2_ELAGV|nr:uncharacterized protein LOC105037472 [Elaeis guineensis]
MESKADDSLSNPSDAPEKDQTLPQDQERAGDADGTIKRLRDEIQALWVQKGELELQLDDSHKKLHRAMADNRSLATEARHLKEHLAAVASASKDFETETDRLKRALNDLEAVVASIAAARAANEAEISALKERLLFPEELEVLWAQIRALERKEIDLRVEMCSVVLGEAAVEEQVKIMEARERELQQVVKSLEESNTRLEMELTEWRSQIDAAVAAARRRLRVSQVLAAVASVGALAAVAVVVYLHHGHRR